MATALQERSAERSRTCERCGMVSRFLEGHEPTWTAWRGDVCPACVALEARREAADMSTEELAEAVRAYVLAHPAENTAQVATGTGAHETAVRKIRFGLVQDGKVPELQAPKGRRRSPTVMLEARQAPVLEALRTSGEAYGAELERLTGISSRTVNRWMRVWEREGKVRSRRAKGNRVLYRLAEE
jgi:hypothetical protein